MTAVTTSKNRITYLVKRSGKRVLFNENKIVQAVWNAMEDKGEGTLKDAEKVKDLVVKKLNDDFPTGTPSVEDVQDRVESALLELKHTNVAKAYILYRMERAKLREQKAALIGGQIDELKLTYNSVRLLEQRYLARDENGQISETPSQLFWRVAKSVAMAELKYDNEPKNAARSFYRMLSNLEFVPSSPTIMNAGQKRKQLSSCFVIPIEDDLEKIFEAVKHAVLVQQAGGGTGFSFSRLRPKGDPVDDVNNVAAGPIAFMKVFATAMQAIKQGGHRQGANMAVLRVDHPSILDFINLKLQSGVMANFNLSVGITEEFMRALDRDEEYQLINPRTGESPGTLSARVVFDSILAVSWRCGDPGIIFLDRINEHNSCSHIGEIEATNPCAEQPLLPYQSCCEGSVNLVKCLKERDGKYELDFEKLRRIVKTSIQFLDDVIDVNHYTLDKIEYMTRGTRRIGLGVMGFADMLLLLRIPYNSDDAVELADKLGKTIRDAAEKASFELAEERGTYPYWRGSKHEQEGKRIRNSGLLGLAPTGSISIIADVSSGIEPNYAFAYTRTLSEGGSMLVINRAFKTLMHDLEIPKEVLHDIAKRGTILETDPLPDDIKRVCVTAQQIAPEWHIKIQAAWQTHVDGAISKTINFPANASVKDIEDGMMLAWTLGCKGLTVYRDSSLDAQILNKGNSS